jgi:hypothetical protein
VKRRKVLAALAAVVVIPLVPMSAAAADVPDPLAPGPHQVVETAYTLGDTAFQPPNFPGPVELTGQAYYPADVERGPYPTVVLLHGRHAPCYIASPPAARGGWPCEQGALPIPSHLGYGELGRSLASHGFAVISISANGINAADALDPASGQPARGELVLAHLDLLRRWSDQPGGALPQNVAKAYNLNQVGLMGHSRGGEGVVNALELNAHRQQRYGIKALLPLAATDFERRVPTGLPMATLLPTCDGDVHDLQGVHYYDDGRYRVATDQAVRHVITVPGANHNYFNSVWSPSSGLPDSRDDWGGRPDSPCAPGQPGRLTELQQRAVGTAYMSSFFRFYLGEAKAFAPLWNGSAPTPPTVAPGKALISYHPPSVTGRRKDINRFAGPTFAANDLGGTVTSDGSLTVRSCGGSAIGVFPSCLRWQQDNQAREPHRGYGFGGVRAQTMSWTVTAATFVNTIPEQHGDARGYQAVQFRAAVDFTSELNQRSAAQDMRVTITDADGKTASAKASQFGTGLEFPPTAVDPYDVIPHLMLNQVRVPLSAFDGVDLSRVRAVGFAFDAVPTGALTMSDLAFTD